MRMEEAMRNGVEMMMVRILKTTGVSDGFGETLDDRCYRFPSGESLVKNAIQLVLGGERDEEKPSPRH